MSPPSPSPTPSDANSVSSGDEDDISIDTPIPRMRSAPPPPPNRKAPGRPVWYCSVSSALTIFNQLLKSIFCRYYNFKKWFVLNFFLSFLKSFFFSVMRSKDQFMHLTGFVDQ